MRIASTDLTLAATRQFSAEHQRSQRLEAWAGDRPAPPPSIDSNDEAAADASDSGLLRALANRARALGLDRTAAVLQAPAAASDVPPESEDPFAPDAKQEAMLRILREIFGMREVASFEFSIDYSRTSEMEARIAQVQQQSVGWGVSFDYHESYRESEVTEVAIAGSVTFADGGTLDLSMLYRRERTFSQETNVSVRLGDARLQDPLVLDLRGQGVAFADGGGTAMDLNGDGDLDMLPTLLAGSAYLVWDRDGDGWLNDAGELFGPHTGNGFSELSALDDDGNGWIDEGDKAFASLGLTTSGSAQLVSLAKAGIGAISTGAVAAPFDLRDSDNALQGRQRAVGLWIGENRRVGAAVQVDVVA